MAQKIPQINPIDWLKDRLYKPSNSMELLSAAYVKEQFEQANQIFKEQMIKFANDYIDDDEDLTAEEYYNETYGCKQTEDLTFKKKSQWTKIDKKQQ